LSDCADANKQPVPAELFCLFATEHAKRRQVPLERARRYEEFDRTARDGTVRSKNVLYIIEAIGVEQRPLMVEPQQPMIQ
jgi:hypothetical protein